MSDENEPEPTDNPKRSRGKRRRGGKKRRGRKNPVATWAKLALGVGATLSTVAISYGIYNKVTAKKKRMRCGEKYRHLAVTASGQTLDDPYGYIPTLADSEEWLQLAKDLVAQARVRYTEMGTLECEATGGSYCGTEDATGSYPRWNALVSLNNQMVGKLDDLDSFWNFEMNVTYVPAIQKAQSIVIDALCLMEKSDEGILYYGGSVPPTPSVEIDTDTSWWKWAAFGGATVMVIGGIGYGVSRTPSGGGHATPRESAVRSDRPRASRPSEGHLTGSE